MDFKPEAKDQGIMTVRVKTERLKRWCVQGHVNQQESEQDQVE